MSALFCPPCGTALQVGDRFCGTCGAKVPEVQEPPVEVVKIPVPPPSSPPAVPVADASAKAGKRSFFSSPLLLIGLGLLLALMAVMFIRPTTDLPVSTPGHDAGKGDVDEPGWQTYINSRYGVAVDYPSAWFVQGEAPPDNAGRNFEAQDGGRFYVYSSANALDQDMDTLHKEVLEGIDPVVIQTDEATADGFTLVMERAEEVNYRHLSTSEGGSMLHWLEIAYPPAQKSRYEPVVQRMLASFRIDPALSGEEQDAAGQSDEASQQSVTGKVIEVQHNGWIFTTPSTDYADLPALMAETDFSSDTEMGQLVFVCQQGNPSTDYFALLVAPMFKHGDSVATTLAMEDSDAALSLDMRDLYASKGGTRPKIDWDSSILFAPIEIEDLGELIQAKALLVSAVGQSWRLVGGKTLKQSGKGFLSDCEGRK